MRHCLRTLVPALFVLAALPSLLRAAEEAPTSPDFSDPKKTMAALAAAVKANDPAQIRACLYIDEKYTVPAEVLLSTMQASMRYKAAIVQKFGDAAAKEIQGAVNPVELMGARMKAVADATVAIDGDTAVMTLNEPATTGNPAGVKTQIMERKITFHKVNDQWKINAAEMMELDTPRVATYLPIMGKISNAMNLTAEEVETNKLATLQEAKQAISQRVIAILQEARKNAAPVAATSQPATSPATPEPTTLPATQP